MIQLLKQTRRSNCGQTAMAMVAGKSIEEMEKLYKKCTATFAYEHVIAAKKLGLDCDVAFTPYTGQELPETCLVRMSFYRRRGGKYLTSGPTKRRGHLVVYHRGDFFDPGGIVYSMRGIPVGMKIDQFLAIRQPKMDITFTPGSGTNKVFKLGDTQTLVEKVFAELPELLTCPRCCCHKPKAEFGVRVMARDERGVATKVIRQSYCKPCRR